MKKKCCFLVPYFGKLPDHFEVFIKTCGFNTDYKWIIFTNDKTEYNYPSNVSVKYMEFEQMQKLIYSKFDFEVSIKEPYKLCDYKPAYGYIFEDYITEYKFWGHCDLDIILGNLNKFITNQMLETYDKLFCLGHMILYKNTYENNRIFMKEYNGRMLYKESFSSENITVFDETFKGKDNINSLFLESEKAVFMKDWSGNFCIFPTKFIKTTFDEKTYSFSQERYKEAVYVWDSGNCYRNYLKDGQLIKEEFMYMHFQSRKMKVSSKLLNNDVIKIVPNVFLPLEVCEITKDNFNSIKKKAICFHYFQVHYKRKRARIKKWIAFKKYKERKVMSVS